MFSRAELEARKTLEELGLKHPANEDLENIVFSLGAYYQEKKLNGKEGRIVSHGNESIITINSEISYPTKKRFCIAHEIGHYILHRNLVPLINDTELDLLNWFSQGPQEREANEFAAEFLMPAEEFSNFCFRKKFSPTLLAEISSFFKTSMTSTIMRFVEKGNHPICVVCSQDDKMNWFKPSKDFRYFLEFEKEKPLPTDSVAHEIFTSANKYSNDQDELEEIWKSTWFKYNEYDEFNKFYEYCLYAPSYGYCLSVIWED